MLFRGIKAKDRPVYRKIALEEAKDFKKIMRDSKADVYRCLIALVVQSSLD
jgi:hypothetical protein